MFVVKASMRSIDLRDAGHAPARGQHVWKLQALLNDWLRSADEGEPPPLLVTDGLGGPRTGRVLHDFQSAFGLDVDAIVGPLTWQALFEFDVRRPD